MIKETTKKLHLIPYTRAKGKAVDTSDAPTINLNRKSGVMWFGQSALNEMGMTDKFVRFYFEPVKKIIGWQIQEQVNQSEMKMWKLCTPYKSKSGNPHWTASLKKMLAQMPSVKKDKYHAVPIQKYREINPLSEYKNQVFYFVELVDEPEELKKGAGNYQVREMATA